MDLDREEVLRTLDSARDDAPSDEDRISLYPHELERFYALAYAAGARAEREKANQEIDELNEVHWRDAD